MFAYKLEVLSCLNKRTNACLNKKLLLVQRDRSAKQGSAKQVSVDLKEIIRLSMSLLGITTNPHNFYIAFHLFKL